jgi:hypothetical protein
MNEHPYLTEKEIMTTLLSGNGLGDSHSYVRLDDTACFLRVWEDGTEESFPPELIFESCWDSIHYINKESDDQLTSHELMLHLGGGGKAVKSNWDDRYIAFGTDGNLNVYHLDGSIISELFHKNPITLRGWYRLSTPTIQ